MADKPFGRIQLDVSPRTHELHATDKLAIPSSLAFAGIPAVEVEAVDIHRHAAEKFHGMLRDFGERENSRVRDLVDLTILLEHGLLVPEQTAAAVRIRMAGTQRHRAARRPPAASRVVARPLPATCRRPQHRDPAVPRSRRPRDSAMAQHVPQQVVRTAFLIQEDLDITMSSRAAVTTRR
ncbi:nucleotidyl transferase AbiEii/AbiGii toxin family protein [Alloactinosynnema sp. L-07]|uniref:nucleotidyl transferase AbiEii/AbiGii toxin family protein n=1 Tax=Alloactinosynnema sp. L-07 TaxID=1653480 RepID=UPI00350EC0F7